MNAIEALRTTILRDVRNYHRGHDRTNLRPYEPGDDYRHIDWNATARTGELYSCVTQTEKALTLASIVDTSASIRVGRGRSLSSAAEEARDTWRRLASPDDRYIDLSKNNVVSALESAHAKLPKGTALLLISDSFATLSMTRALTAKCRCTLLLARDPWYDEFPLRGFHCIRDIETNESRTLFFGPSECKRYRAAVRKREDTIVSQFSSAGWRTGILTEDNGAEALFTAFDIFAPGNNAWGGLVR